MSTSCGDSKNKGQGIITLSLAEYRKDVSVGNQEIVQASQQRASNTECITLCFQTIILGTQLGYS